MKTILDPNTEFDHFLYAPLGDDLRGSMVSVLSALARLGYDPWLQAAEFARLPTKAAEAGLALAIADVPGMSPMRSDTAEVAACLIALLPCALRPSTRFSSASVEGGQTLETRSRQATFFIMVAMVLGLVVQILVAGYQPPVKDGPALSKMVATTPSAGGLKAGSQIR